MLAPMRTGTLVVAALLAVAACKKTATTKAAPDESAIAIAAITHLARGETDAAIALMPPAAKATAPALAAEWKKRAGDGGALREVTARRFPDDPTVFAVRATFERGTLDSMVSVERGTIAHLSMGLRYVAPDYVDLQAFTEHEVAVGAGKTALPGVLSLPKRPGPAPVVILVHGSGPSDLDEHDGALPLFLFRDLAWGLASRDVAVLRYNKRTLGLHFNELGVPIDRFTVADEYFADVRNAVELLGRDPRIDPKRIFVLGHSEGGWLTPWILRDQPRVAGGIIASGNARTFADVLPDQVHYLASLQPGASTFDVALAEKLTQAQVDRAKDPQLADDHPPAELPLGLPAAYWKFVQGYDAPAVAATLGRPLLVLQGGRDYNVTMVDFELWRRYVPGADFHDYPALDHHYVAGSGRATPDDLRRGGHADRAVIDDVAAWVRAH